MTIYLSGPMSGLPDYNYPAFDAAAATLRRNGHTVFNPTETFGGATFLRKEQYLAVDYVAVQVCDGLVTLPGWESSVGATAERAVALSLGKPVWEFAEFVQRGSLLLIGLVGYAGSGKDEAAKYLVEERGFTRVAFADPLKAVASAIGWDGRKDDIGRRLLQDLGLAARQYINADVWLNAGLETIDATPGSVVVTDCRFQNEIDAIRARGGVVWRVDRPGVGPANGHVSEHEWTTIEPDAVIVNDGTIRDLRERMREAMCPDTATNKAQIR